MIPLPYLALGAVGLAVAAGFVGYREGADDVYAEWDKAKLEVEQAYSQALHDAAVRQMNLEDEVNELRQTYATEKAQSDARIADLLVSLSKRPDRPTKPRALPDTTCPVPVETGCTGAELYRPDSEFLIRESARADNAVRLLRECRTAYEQVTAAIRQANQTSRSQQ